MSVTSEIHDIVTAAARARDELYRMSAEVDRTTDSAEAMHVAWRAGIHRLSITREFGGLSDGDPRFGLEAAASALLDIAAGEQSVGQMVGTQFLLLRTVFTSDTKVSTEVRQAIASAFASEETRFFGAGNPTGVPSNPGLVATRVPGGLRIDGTIAFATQSNGKRGIVACNAWLPTDDGSDYEMVTGYTRLGEPGVIVHDDWDNMGQRATGSGGMTLEGVLVPDGWWHPFDLAARAARGLGAPGFPLVAIMLLGMGEAAYRAEVEFLTTRVDRPIWPIFSGPGDDVLVHRRLGKHKTSLAAARALVMQAARDAAHADESTDYAELTVQSVAARQAATEAALYVSADMFELTGARSTAAKYDMDRFWRNARTLGIHDAADIDYVTIGHHALNGAFPPAGARRLAQIMRKPAVDDARNTARS